MKRFDFLVIGGGSGGIAAARRAASHGARVALFENKKLGGTCVNVGCVPKKIFWNASRIAETLHDAGDYGFTAAAGSFDWRALKSKRDAYVKRLNAIYRDGLDSGGVHTVTAAAVFVDARTIGAGGELYSAPHILIASGGRPLVPPVPGAELGITSDGFFALEKMPRRAAVVGAGYIATEFAGVLGALGADVTQVLRKEKILREFDRDLGALVTAQMKNAGVTIATQSQPAALEKTGGKIKVRTAAGGLGEFDCVIWAVGRRPNSGGLQLQNAGIATDRHGHIGVDKFQNTAAAGVYAVGDVTGRKPLTPVAIAAGRKLADRVFGGEDGAHLDYANIPTVVFSHPPIGTVGMSEHDARAKFGDAVRVYQNQFTDLYFAPTERKPRTMVKLITRGVDEKIIGCHIAGHSADEIIQGFAVAIKMGARKRDLDNTVAIHPTAGEELVTLR